MNAPIYFLDKLSFNVPDDVGAATRRVADRHGVSVADLLRAAIADRLAREGEAVQRTPHLRILRGRGAR